jgi:hypothetical protein
MCLCMYVKSGGIVGGGGTIKQFQNHLFLLDLLNIMNVIGNIIMPAIKNISEIFK